MLVADVRLIQLYFDITCGNQFDAPDTTTFEYMYLDFVVSSDGSIEVVDRDELDDALRSGTITAAQHRESVENCGKLERFLRENTAAVLDWCRARQRELKKEAPN